MPFFASFTSAMIASQRLDARLERLGLGFGVVVADAVGSASRELRRADVAQHVDRDALRPVLPIASAALVVFFGRYRPIA